MFLKIEILRSIPVAGVSDNKATVQKYEIAHVLQVYVSYIVHPWHFILLFFLRRIIFTVYDLWKNNVRWGPCFVFFSNLFLIVLQDVDILGKWDHKTTTACGKFAVIDYFLFIFIFPHALPCVTHVDLWYVTSPAAHRS